MVTKLVTVKGGSVVVLPARVTVEVVAELDDSMLTVVLTVLVKVVVEEVTVVTAKTVAEHTDGVMRDLTDAIPLPAAPA